MIAIYDEVFFKFRVSFYGIVIMKEVFYESIHCIETHLDVVKEVFEIHSNVYFVLCPDEELI